MNFCICRKQLQNVIVFCTVLKKSSFKTYLIKARIKYLSRKIEEEAMKKHNTATTPTPTKKRSKEISLLFSLIIPTPIKT